MSENIQFALRFGELTLPTNLTRIHISDITEDINTEDKYIKGTVLTRWPMQKLNKNGLLLKAIIKDEDDDSKTNLIKLLLVDEFASKCEYLHQRDTIVISDFIVEKSPTAWSDHGHKCQVVADFNKADSVNIWIYKDNDKVIHVPCSTESVPESSPVSSSNVSVPESSLHGTVSTTTTSQTPVAAIELSTVTTTTCNYLKFMGKKYTPLKLLKEGVKVDVYGVVKFFKPPFKTKGTDYCMSLTIIDPSLESSDPGLKCVLFSKDSAMLPQVHAVGDVVRLHRLKIQKFRGELQAGKGPGFAALAFDGHSSAPHEPRTGCKNYTFTNEDKQIVQELRDWLSTESQLDIDELRCPLENVSVGQYFDIVCQVVGLTSMESNSCVLLKIWDGTKCPSVVHREDAVDCSINYDKELRSRAENFMVDVCCYDNHMETAIKIKPGQFILIHNLHAARFKNSQSDEDIFTSEPAIEFALHRGTAYGRGITFLPEGCFEVEQLKRRMEKTSPAKCVQGQHLEQITDVTSSVGDSLQSCDFSSDVILLSCSDKVEKKDSHQTDRLAQRNSGEEKRLIPSDRGAHEQKQSGKDGLANACDDGFQIDNKYSACQLQTRLATRQAPSNEKLANENSSSNILQNEPASQITAVEKQANKSRCMQDSASVVTGHYHIKPTSLSTVAIHPVPYKFRIRAKVLSYLPKAIEDFVHLWCPTCKYSCQVPREEPHTPSKGTRSSTQQDQKSAEDTRNSKASRRSRRLRKKQSDLDTETPPMKVLRPQNQQGESPKRSLMTRKAKGSPVWQSPRKQVKSQVAQRKSANDKELSDKSSDEGGQTLKNRSPIKGKTAELVEQYSQKDTVGRCAKTARARKCLAPLVGGLTVDETRYYQCPRCATYQDELLSAEIEDLHIGQYWDDAKRIPKTVNGVSILLYKFFFQLTLSDGSEKIDVLVVKEHAETFFQNIQPADVGSRQETQWLLQDYMMSLCPHSTDHISAVDSEDSENEGRPWLECCIMSYDLRRQDEMVTKYQMFDTTLALNVAV